MDSRHQHLAQKRTRSQRRTISASPQAVYVLERVNCRQTAQVKILRINIKPGNLVGERSATKYCIPISAEEWKKLHRLKSQHLSF